MNHLRFWNNIEIKSFWLHLQVSIRLYDSYSNINTGDSYILCSGTIVHPFFVLTTGHCLHSHIFSQGIGWESLILQLFWRPCKQFCFVFSRPLSPGMVYVVAGNFSTKPLVVRYVNAIYINNNYKYNTNENDIALLKVLSLFVWK